MYTYDFVFYKPGKKFYTGYEIKRTINTLVNHGYKVSPVSPHSPYFKEGKLIIQDKEEHLDLHLEKSGQTFFFHLGPAQEEIHGVIGGLSIPEEQFEEDPEKSAELMIEAANRIFIGLDVLFAWGDHELEIGRLEPFLRFDKIAALAWANFFSRELVERLGGLDKVLLFPDMKKSYEGKPWKFTCELTSHLPSEPLPDQLALECQKRYPGVVLRMPELPPLPPLKR